LFYSLAPCGTPMFVLKYLLYVLPIFTCMVRFVSSRSISIASSFLISNYIMLISLALAMVSKAFDISTIGALSRLNTKCAK